MVTKVTDDIGELWNAFKQDQSNQDRDGATAAPATAGRGSGGGIERRHGRDWRVGRGWLGALGARVPGTARGRGAGERPAADRAVRDADLVAVATLRADHRGDQSRPPKRAVTLPPAAGNLEV